MVNHIFWSVTCNYMQIRIQAIIFNTFWVFSYIQLNFLASLPRHMCRLLRMLFCTKSWIMCPVMIYSQQMLYSKYATSAVLHGYIFSFAWIQILSTEYSKQNLAKNTSALFLAATVTSSAFFGHLEWGLFPTYPKECWELPARLLGALGAL